MASTIWAFVSVIMEFHLSNNMGNYQLDLILFQSAQHKTTTKMTWEKVRNTRQLYQDGSMSQDQLGKKYKICSSIVSRIVNNKLWIEE